MKSSNSVQIAGSRTVGDWTACRAKLGGSNDPLSWKAAYEDFFATRLRSRYFDPIEAIQQSKNYEGEVFSIVTIQCSLIEFLGSTLEGMSYRHQRRGVPALKPFEYSDSIDMFVGFLTKAPPFMSVFGKSLAQDFYRSVRCGLIHEARTKNGWLIMAASGAELIVDGKEKIVYRDNLQRAFEDFCRWYGTALQREKRLQEAFLRKFDSLCEN